MDLKWHRKTSKQKTNKQNQATSRTQQANLSPLAGPLNAFGLDLNRKTGMHVLPSALGHFIVSAALLRSVWVCLLLCHHQPAPPPSLPGEPATSPSFAASTILSGVGASPIAPDSQDPDPMTLVSAGPFRPGCHPASGGVQI